MKNEKNLNNEKRQSSSVIEENNNNLNLNENIIKKVDMSTNNRSKVNNSIFNTTDIYNEKTYLLKKRVPTKYLSEIQMNEIKGNNINNYENSYNTSDFNKFKNFQLNDSDKIDEKTYQMLSNKLQSDYNAKLEISNGALKLSINDFNLNKLKNSELNEFNEYFFEGFELVEFLNEEEIKENKSENNSDLDALSIDYGDPSEEENENYENDNEFSNSFEKDNHFINCNLEKINLDNRINEYNDYFTKIVYKSNNKSVFKDKDQESYYNDFYK